MDLLIDSLQFLINSASYIGSPIEGCIRRRKKNEFCEEKAKQI